MKIKTNSKRKLSRRKTCGTDVSIVDTKYEYEHTRTASKLHAYDRLKQTLLFQQRPRVGILEGLIREKALIWEDFIPL